MKFFHFFKKRRNTNTKRKRRSRKSTPVAKRLIERIEADVENMQAQIGTINIALKKHDDELLEHGRLISETSQGLQTLEQKVSDIRVAPAVGQPIATVRPIQIISPSTPANPMISSSMQKFDINRFSEQEKRILAVFFQNKEMCLSYVDIGRALNKSPYTIKNQINRMRLKADLFDRTIGDQSRNRFKLKDSLRIEKYLNIG